MCGFGVHQLVRRPKASKALTRRRQGKDSRVEERRGITEATRFPSPLIKPDVRISRIPPPCHVWTAPWMQEKSEKSDGRVDCDHVSGLCDAAPCPLAQMGSAIQPQTTTRLRKPWHGTGSLDRRFDRSSSHS